MAALRLPVVIGEYQPIVLMSLSPRSRGWACLVIFAATIALTHIVPQAAAQAAVCQDLKPEVVVESVAKNSEGEKAGLVERDIITSWSRGDSNGQIRTPFDLIDVETEQGPRGALTLQGTRAGTKQSWMMGPGKWEIKSRPDLPEPILHSHLEAQELAKAGKLVEAAGRWRAEANRAETIRSCNWVSAWFLFHAADLLSDARQWEPADHLYLEAIERASKTQGESSSVLVAKSWADLGYDANERGDLEKAEEYEGRALGITEKLAPESLAVSKLLFTLASIADDRGHLAKAEDYYLQALSIREKLALNSLVLADTLNSLGRLYSDRGDLAKADEYHRRALGIQQKSFPDSPDVAVSLFNLGNNSSRRQDLTKAEEYFKEALAIVERHDPEGFGVASVLIGLGNVAFARGDLEKDEEYQLRSLAIIEKESPESLKVAISLNNLGYIEMQRGDLTRSEEYHLRALAIRQKAAPETLEVADSLTHLGLVALHRGNLEKAKEYHLKAFAIRQRLAPQSPDFAATLNNLGQVAETGGNLIEAEQWHTQALALRQKLAPGSLLVAASLNNLAIVVFKRGDLSKAEEYFEQSLAIKEKVAPGSQTAANTLDNLANLETTRGELAKAEGYERRALAIGQGKYPDSLLFSSSLSNFARLMLYRGDLVDAENSYLRSLAILKKSAPEGDQMVNCLANLGQLARTRGDSRLAINYLEAALKINQKIAPNGVEAADIMGSLGDIALDGGDLSLAQEHYSRSLTILREKAPESIATAAVLASLGNLSRSRSNLTEADSYYHQALSVEDRLAPMSLSAAEIRVGLGHLAEDRRELGQAKQYYQGAIEIEAKLAPNSAGYAESLAALAGMQRKERQFEQSEKLYSEAIEVLERQLSSFGGAVDVRARFRSQHTNYYSEYADLLVHQNKPEQAFEVMERSRARTLLETLAEAHVDIREGADPATIDKERLLQATLKVKADRKINLLAGEHTPEQLVEIDKEIGEVLTEYEDLEGHIRSSSPRYASLTQPKLLSAQEVQQQLLDRDTVLLEYALGVEHSYLFAVTFTSLDAYELPKRSEIESAARYIHEVLTTRNQPKDGETAGQRKVRLEKAEAEYKKAANRLSQMIFSPVAETTKGKRLLIVADGALQYVPFGLLPVSADPAKPVVPLIAEHEIVNLPSASVLAVLRRQASERTSKPRKEVVVLADPVFGNDDPRVAAARASKSGQPVPADKIETAGNSIAPRTEVHLTRSLQDVQGDQQRSGLARLAFSRREAAAIMAVTTPRDSMQALDFQASRETALNKDLSRYKIIHFATHGLLDNEHPELSGLVLSLVDSSGKPRDGFLDLEDVYNLDLPADLVVLSACETGLGKEISGEGLVGLTRGFMYAGASRVVASLWNVDDAATAELMGAFYRGMLKEGLRPAAALREAQRQLMKQKRFSSPYYWAAFTLQGEWK